MGCDCGTQTERPAVPICNSFQSLVGLYFLLQATLYALPACKSLNTLNSGRDPLRQEQWHPFTWAGRRPGSSDQSIFGHYFFSPHLKSKRNRAAGGQKCQWGKMRVNTQNNTNWTPHNTTEQLSQYQLATNRKPWALFLKWGLKLSRHKKETIWGHIAQARVKRWKRDGFTGDPWHFPFL